MEKQTFAEWYRQTGCSSLNRILLELKGKGVGWIPVSNLIPEEFCGQQSQKELIGTLVHDGLSVDEKRYSDGSGELFVFIK